MLIPTSHSFVDVIEERNSGGGRIVVHAEDIIIKSCRFPKASPLKQVS